MANEIICIFLNDYGDNVFAIISDSSSKNVLQLWVLQNRTVQQNETYTLFYFDLEKKKKKNQKFRRPILMPSSKRKGTASLIHRLKLPIIC